MISFWILATCGQVACPFHRNNLWALIGARTRPRQWFSMGSRGQPVDGDDARLICPRHPDSQPATGACRRHARPTPGLTAFPRSQIRGRKPATCAADCASPDLSRGSVCVPVHLDVVVEFIQQGMNRAPQYGAEAVAASG